LRTNDTWVSDEVAENPDVQPDNHAVYSFRAAIPNENASLKKLGGGDTWTSRYVV
jgi:hypothetical protein